MISHFRQRTREKSFRVQLLGPTGPVLSYTLFPVSLVLYTDEMGRGRNRVGCVNWRDSESKEKIFTFTTWSLRVCVKDPDRRHWYNYLKKLFVNGLWETHVVKCSFWRPDIVTVHFKVFRQHKREQMYKHLQVIKKYQIDKDWKLESTKKSFPTKEWSDLRVTPVRNTDWPETYKSCIVRELFTSCFLLSLPPSFQIRNLRRV